MMGGEIVFIFIGLRFKIGYPWIWRCFNGVLNNLSGPRVFVAVRRFFPINDMLRKQKF